MAYGFDLEEVMGDDEIQKIESKSRGKYDHLYCRFQEVINKENHNWLKISDLENYTRAACIRKGIKNKFSDKTIDAKIRKYDLDGQINFSVYVRYLFG